jgi:hypothetical protein
MMKMIIIRIIQEFVEKYKYTEAEGIMLGGLYFGGPLDNYSILYILTTHEQ